MTVEVRYYCPRCGAIATLDRDPYLADKSVTPFPLEGWTYAEPAADFEDADGVRLLCGEHTDENESDEGGCDESFYLNFVRFEEGQEVETVPEREYVTIGVDEQPPSPTGPDGPWSP